MLPAERDAELIERLADATLETEDDLEVLPEVTLLAPEAEAVPVRTRRPTPATDCRAMPDPGPLVAISLSMI